MLFRSTAAKILELECEIETLQDAYARATAEDETTQADSERLGTVQKARRERQTSFRFHSEDEENDEYKSGTRPSKSDEGSFWHDSWDKAGDSSPSKGFFPSTESKPKATLPSGKGTSLREEIGATFSNGKLVDEKIDFSAWPSITAFRTWKLAIKKKIAAASRYSQEAFAWVCKVEAANKFEDLEDSGPESWQVQLDTKISAEIDKILSGEFRKQVQIQETALSNSGKMIKAVKSCG